MLIVFLLNTQTLAPLLHAVMDCLTQAKQPQPQKKNRLFTNLGTQSKITTNEKYEVPWPFYNNDKEASWMIIQQE